MQFFKQQHVITKLKDDAEKLEKTMDYIDERLANPCEIYTIEKSWPAENMLRMDIDDTQTKRIEIEEFLSRNLENADKINVFRKSTAGFIKTIDAHLCDIYNQLIKFGMKPMIHGSIPGKQDNVMTSLENQFDESSTLTN